MISTACFATLPPPRAGTLEVFVRHIDETLAMAGEMETLLSAEERVRASRLRRDADRSRFIESHAFLRHVLGCRAGVAPAMLTFDAGEHGKPSSPEAAAKGISFNMSHTRCMAVIALAGDGRAVGVDVETAEARVDVLGIARSRFTPRESGVIAAESPETRALAFKRIWTRKEALHKADGRGLALSLAAYDVLDAPRDGWLISDLELPESHVGAVAYAAGPAPIAVVTSTV